MPYRALVHPRRRAANRPSSPTSPEAIVTARPGVYQRRMNPRVRKAVGSLGILLFLGVYIWLAVTVGGHLPKAWWAQLPYYVVVGVAWGLPIIPLITWMNRER